ncbi:MAG: hypothetical protein ABL921_33665, partial [Pirellula sp.]
MSDGVKPRWFRLILLSLIALSHRIESLEAGGRIPTTLHPQSYYSESREYSVTVDPSNREGAGKSKCTLTKYSPPIPLSDVAQAPVWTSDFPFTLYHACVTNNGCVVGYAYTHGLEGFGPARSSGYGELLVVVIDLQGNATVMDRIARRSGVLHEDPNPTAEQVLVLEKRQMFIVRIQGLTDNNDMNTSTSERWRVYSYRDKNPIDEIEPEVGKGIIHNCQNVLDTDLVLCQLLTYGKNQGAIYHLVDLDGHSHWSLNRSGDFHHDEESVERQIDAVIRRDKTIHSVSPKQFDIGFVSESQRVTFGVETNSFDEMTVRELTRRPWQWNQQKPEQTSITNSLNHVAKIELQSPGNEHKHPVRDIDGFDFDLAENIGFVRRETARPDTFVLTSQKGNILAEIPLDVETIDDLKSWSSVVGLGVNRFLVTQSEPEDGAKSKAWIVDARTKTIEPLGKFACPNVKCGAAFSDGSFAILATETSEFTMTDSIICFSQLGEKHWTIDQSYERFPQRLFSPESIAVSTDDELLVLDNINHTVQVFDRAGKYRKVHSLSALWGREPNYPTEIASMPDGGFVVYDFRGNPALTAMNEFGNVVKSLSCRKDLQLSDVHPSSSIRTTKDGSIWMTNRSTIMRVSNNGKFDVELGNTNPNQLGAIASVTVDRNGKFYAISGDTGTIHAFQPDGRFDRIYDHGKLRNVRYVSNPIQVLLDGRILVNVE